MVQIIRPDRRSWLGHALGAAAGGSTRASHPLGEHRHGHDERECRRNTTRARAAFGASAPVTSEFASALASSESPHGEPAARRAPWSALFKIMSRWRTRTAPRLDERRSQDHFATDLTDASGWRAMLSTALGDAPLRFPDRLRSPRLSPDAAPINPSQPFRTPLLRAFATLVPGWSAIPMNTAVRT